MHNPNLSLTYLFIHGGCDAVLRQLDESSYSCNITQHQKYQGARSDGGANGGICWSNIGERFLKTRFCCLLFALTGVALLLSLTQQLEVFVPDAQLFPAGEPHRKLLQNQQTLKPTQKREIRVGNASETSARTRDCNSPVHDAINLNLQSKKRQLQVLTLNCWGEKLLLRQF